MRRLILLPLILILAAGVARAQAPSGYVKIGSEPVTVTAYNDLAVSSGQVWEYVVTATGPGGESLSSNIITATIPNTTVVHEVSLTWVPGTTGGTATGFNIYRQQVMPPSAPSVSATVL